MTWTTALANKWGGLAQGINNCTAATYTIDFIHKHKVPTDKKLPMVISSVTTVPSKAEKYRVRLTVGGDRLDYNKDAGSPAASDAVPAQPTLVIT
jgi:hypothetical protein